MKKILLFTLLMSLFLTSFAQNWRTDEMEVKVYLKNAVEGNQLYNLNLRGEVYPTGYGLFNVTPDELIKIKQLGLHYEITKANLSQFFKDNAAMLEAYHNYDQNVALMDSLQIAYPNICKRYQFGVSAGGHPIYGLKVSNNVSVNENEPEVMFDGGIHGDELIGQEITIRLARYLCTNYGSNTTVTDLVNSREIWLYPNVNPDGRIAMQRENANGVDVNRDWGYMWDPGTPAPSSQPETHALRSAVLNHQFTVHTSYHGGTEYLSYPWSYRPEIAPDKPHLDYLAQLYHSSSGYENLPYGQGYSGMYPINGSSKDYNYAVMGSITWSCEVSNDKQPPASQISMYWNYNRPAMLKMIEYAGYGISGLITDSVTGAPVRAAIFVGSDFPAYTDSTVGDYHRFLIPGTYTLKIVANGYQTKTISNVVVTANQCTVNNIVLQPTANAKYVYKVIGCQIPGNNFADAGYTPGVIGSPDGTYYSLGKSGWIIVDMGTPVIEGPGNDFKVIEGDNSPEGYSCYVSTAIDGPWISLGNATGTHEFDLANANIPEARYIKIMDDGDGSASGNHIGFDLDAIQVLEPISGVYLTMLNHSIDDASGNGNGRIDVGETVNLNFTIRNSGDITAQNTVGTITCSDPYITIVAGTSNLGNLAQGQSGNGTFTLTASPDTPIGHPFSVNINFTANNGTYTKDFTLGYSVGLILEDFETGAFTSFSWVQGGNQPWIITNVQPYEGVYCAKSGAIGNSQKSDLSLAINVAGSDSISFYYKVSSESGWDYLKFFIDATVAGQWSGTADWTRVAFPVVAGNHTFKWEYMKDGSSASGSDCSWLDFIVLPSPVPSGQTVSGIINYANTASTPLSGITVKLKNASGNVVGTTTTNAAGSYSFSGVTAGTYTLEVTTTKLWGGVTATDVLLYRKHIANISSLSGIYLASGDVNASGSLTASDVLLIRKRIAAIINSFSVGDWLFNNTTITVGNSNVTQNFNGIVYGDANGSYSPVESPTIENKKTAIIE